MDIRRRWSLNVWGGIVGEHVVGPYFFEGHLNGQMYLQFLEHGFWDLLENIPLNIIQNLWLQHDGASPHYNLDIRNEF